MESIVDVAIRNDDKEMLECEYCEVKSKIVRVGLELTGIGICTKCQTLKCCKGGKTVLKAKSLGLINRKVFIFLRNKLINSENKKAELEELREKTECAKSLSKIMKKYKIKN